MKAQKSKGITFAALSISLIAMSIVVILAVVKIYLSNRIYYESRTINNLTSEVAALREEHSILQMNVERLKYKSEVTDTIFTMEPETDEKSQNGEEEQ